MGEDAYNFTMPMQEKLGLESICRQAISQQNMEDVSRIVDCNQAGMKKLDRRY